LIEIFKIIKGNTCNAAYDINRIIKGNTYQQSDYSGVYLYTDTLPELKGLSKQKPVITKQIQSKDKVYFASGCGYPSLLFSKYKSDSNIKLDLTRTTSPDRADVIVISPEWMDDYNPWNCHLSTLYNDNNVRWQSNTFDGFNESAAAINRQKLTTFLGREAYFMMKISNTQAETFELVRKYPNKIVYTMDLIEYVFPFLPVMTDSELDIIISMLKTSDEQARATGIQMFQYSNFSDKIYTIVRRLKTEVPYVYFPSESAASAAWKYLYSCLGIPVEKFTSGQSYASNITFYATKVMGNPLNTQNLDDLKADILSQLVEKLKSDTQFSTFREDLALVGYRLTVEPIPEDDSDGETESRD